MGGTKWSLSLRPNSSGFESCIACGIKAEDSLYSPKEFKFDYELSILATDGSVQHSELFLKKLYKEGYEDWSSALYIKSDEVFLPKTDLFIPYDFLTIRCRIWDSQYPITLSGRCFAETSFEAKTKSSRRKIEKFSSLETGEKYPFSNNYYSGDSIFSTLNLCVAADGKLAIEVEFLNQNSIPLHMCNIYIRDILGHLVKCGQGEARESKHLRVPLTLSRGYLMKNETYYLQGDMLTIECEVLIPTGEIAENISETEYGFEYQDTLNLISDSKNPLVFSERQRFENLTALKDDLTSLFMDGILCDTNLKTDTEIFPAHTVVLSARSPVFQSMFSTDMKEKANNCVNIDDLDADTVRRMLLFMYSGNLDDLEYESAKTLYFAADKYNIASLRQRCSSFLMQNLLHSNCCNALLLSDIFQDQDLKDAVLDFIAENDEAVLVSDEWKSLEKDHPQLTIEAYRTVCMKNRKR